MPHGAGRAAGRVPLCAAADDMSSNIVSAGAGAAPPAPEPLGSMPSSSSVRFAERLELRGLSISPTMVLVFELYLAKQVGPGRGGAGQPQGMLSSRRSS